jgi:hypothetical protein
VKINIWWLEIRLEKSDTLNNKLSPHGKAVISKISQIPPKYRYVDVIADLNFP